MKFMFDAEVGHQQVESLDGIDRTDRMIFSDALDLPLPSESGAYVARIPSELAGLRSSANPFFQLLGGIQ